jgi:hypothetical protein
MGVFVISGSIRPCCLGPAKRSHWIKAILAAQPLSEFRWRTRPQLAVDNDTDRRFWIPPNLMVAAALPLEFVAVFPQQRMTSR